LIIELRKVGGKIETQLGKGAGLRKVEDENDRSWGRHLTDFQTRNPLKRRRGGEYQSFLRNGDQRGREKRDYENLKRASSGSA